MKILRRLSSPNARFFATARLLFLTSSIHAYALHVFRERLCASAGIRASAYGMLSGSLALLAFLSSLAVSFLADAFSALRPALAGCLVLSAIGVFFLFSPGFLDFRLSLAMHVCFCACCPPLCDAFLGGSKAYGRLRVFHTIGFVLSNFVSESIVRGDLSDFQVYMPLKGFSIISAVIAAIVVFLHRPTITMCTPTKTQTTKDITDTTTPEDSHQQQIISKSENNDVDGSKNFTRNRNTKIPLDYEQVQPRFIQNSTNNKAYGMHTCCKAPRSFSFQNTVKKSKNSQTDLTSTSKILKHKYSDCSFQEEVSIQPDQLFRTATFFDTKKDIITIKGSETIKEKQFDLFSQESFKSRPGPVEYSDNLKCTQQTHINSLNHPNLSETQTNDHKKNSTDFIISNLPDCGTSSTLTTNISSFNNKYTSKDSLSHEKNLFSQKNILDSKNSSSIFEISKNDIQRSQTLIKNSFKCSSRFWRLFSLKGWPFFLSREFLALFLVIACNGISRCLLSNYLTAYQKQFLLKEGLGTASSMAAGVIPEVLILWNTTTILKIGHPTALAVAQIAQVMRCTCYLSFNPKSVFGISLIETLKGVNFGMTHAAAQDILRNITKKENIATAQALYAGTFTGIASFLSGLVSAYIFRESSKNDTDQNIEEFKNMFRTSIVLAGITVGIIILTHKSLSKKKIL